MSTELAINKPAPNPSIALLHLGGQFWQACGRELWIALPCGRQAVTDIQHYQVVSKYRWFSRVPSDGRYTPYAYAHGRNDDGSHKTIYLHRLITEAKKGSVVDHLDDDGLNNLSKNLLVCSPARNVVRSTLIPRHNKSGVKGVFWNSNARRWTALSKVNGRTVRLGNFQNKSDAASAYQQFTQNRLATLT